MPTFNEPTTYIELTKHTLIVAQTKDAHVQFVRECSLLDKSALEETFNSLQPDWKLVGLRAITGLTPQPSYWHCSTAAEAALHRTEFSLRVFGERLPHTLSGALELTACHAADGTLIFPDGTARWLLGITSETSLALAHANASENRIECTKTVSSTLGRIGAIADSLRFVDRGSALLWDLTMDRSHIFLITSRGVQAVVPCSVGLEDIFTAVQTAVGLTFRGAATRIFYDSSFDFTETGSKVAAYIAPALKAAIASLPPSDSPVLSCTSMLGKQSWFVREAAHAIGLQPWAPKISTFCAKLKLDFTSPEIEAALTPSALGLMHLIASEQGDSVWHPSWSRAGITRLATAAPFFAPALSEAARPSARTASAPPVLKSSVSKPPIAVASLAKPPVSTSSAPPVSPSASTPPVKSPPLSTPPWGVASRTISPFAVPERSASPAPSTVPEPRPAAVAPEAPRKPAMRIKPSLPPRPAPPPVPVASAPRPRASLIPKMNAETVERLRDEACIHLCRAALRDSLSQLEKDKRRIAGTRPPFGLLGTKKAIEAYEASIRTAQDNEILHLQQLKDLEPIEHWLQSTLQDLLHAFLDEANPEYHGYSETCILVERWQNYVGDMNEFALGFARDARSAAGLMGGRNSSANFQLQQVISNLRATASHLHAQRIRIELLVKELAHLGKGSKLNVALPTLPAFHHGTWVDRILVLSPYEAIRELKREEEVARSFCNGGKNDMILRAEAIRSTCLRTRLDFLNDYWAELRPKALEQIPDPSNVAEMLENLRRDYVEADLQRRQESETNTPFSLV